MRLDKFLKTVRIIKRRTVAQEVIKAGLVRKGDQVLKPSYEVKPDDTLDILYGTKEFKIKVNDNYSIEILEEKRRSDIDEEHS